MNLQVISAPDGDIVRVSGPLPGATHDLTAARIWGILRELATSGLTVLPQAGQIPLTRNQIAWLVAAWSSSPRETPGAGCDGPPGAASTSTEPKPATTGSKPANHQRNDVGLPS